MTVRLPLFTSVTPELLRRCRADGKDAVLWEGSLLPFLADLIAAGGSWKQLSTVVWDVSRGLFNQLAFENVIKAFPFAQIAVGLQPEAVTHAEGLFDVSLGELRAAIWSGHRFHPDPRARVQVLLFIGRSRDEALDLLRQVLAQRKQPRLRLWGGGRSDASPAPILEDQVILEPSLRGELLGELDRYWQYAARAQGEGLIARRGLLLVGPPGTGKTRLIRHLITRYPQVDAHLFVPGRQHHQNDQFAEMLAQVRFGGNPAMVILEDIDRLTESGAVTPSYLLNCLDGLIESPVPTLWIATSNDPSRLDPNLLDRPGRFDRTIVLELPELALREALILLHLERPLPDACLRAAAEAAAGLSGAHIREACIASRLAVIESGGAPEDLLLREVNRLRQQQRKVQGLAHALTSGQVGFTTAR